MKIFDLFAVVLAVGLAGGCASPGPIHPMAGVPNVMIESAVVTADHHLVVCIQTDRDPGSTYAGYGTIVSAGPNTDNTIDNQGWNVGVRHLGGNVYVASFDLEDHPGEAYEIGVTSAATQFPVTLVFKVEAGRVFRYVGDAGNGKAGFIPL